MDDILMTNEQPEDPGYEKLLKHDFNNLMNGLDWDATLPPVDPFYFGD